MDYWWNITRRPKMRPFWEFWNNLFACCHKGESLGDLSMLNALSLRWEATNPHDEFGHGSG
jgi:hypothetical protein